MNLLHWNEEIYSVGIRKMDDHHKQLIGLINALHQQRENTNTEFIENVLTTLVHYTRIHFNEEEKMLRKIHYPHVISHHKQHLRFIETVEKLKQIPKDGGTNTELVDKISHFLSEWIKHHILVEDKAYGQYIEG